MGPSELDSRWYLIEMGQPPPTMVMWRRGLTVPFNFLRETRNPNFVERFPGVDTLHRTRSALCWQVRLPGGHFATPEGKPVLVKSPSTVCHQLRLKQTKNQTILEISLSISNQWLEVHEERSSWRFQGLIVVSHCCCNKLPQTEWLKQCEFIILQFCRSEV